MAAPVVMPATSVVDEPAVVEGSGAPATAISPTATGAEMLAAFAPIVAAVAQRGRDSAELGAEKLEAGKKFLDEFATACATGVRPAMNAVLQQLRQLGGGGLLEEHPGGEARFTKPRIALWMSLEGEVGVPRLDRYPYLLLEADVDRGKVQVDEGDMWRGAGGNSSGRVGAWDIVDLTEDHIVKELLAIAERAGR
jgi:hypothetical protein